MSRRAAAACAATMLLFAAAGCNAEPSTTRAASRSASAAKHASAPGDPRLTAAVLDYHAYVDAQLTALLDDAAALARAIDAGDRAAARRRYPVARRCYERIEPAAELWGTLDLQIDGRANDLVPPQPFTGFHRLEQGIWAARADPTLPAVADQLLARIRRLRALAARTRYTVLQLTSGATELLNEIQSNKITGEEERYSHLDLVDIASNVEGVREVVAVLRPFLRAQSPALLATIDSRYALLVALLARHADNPGYDSSGYQRFTAVSVADRRGLAAAVQALAEPVALLTQATSS